MPTPFPNFSRPGSSTNQEFNFYNPKCEKKAKDRARRTCISCYNRQDRKCNVDVDSCEYCLPKNIWCRAPIRTPKLFDLGPLDEFTRNYNLNQPAATSEDTEERPSACVLSVSWPSAEVKPVPDTHKSSSLLNTKAFFEHRNKVGFPSQRKAVAKSLAQVCASIEIYGLAYWETLRMASPISNLALDHGLLIQHLEFLGKGIDPKVFNAARQTPSPRTTVINVSTVNTDRAIVSDMMTSTVTFRDIMAQKPLWNPASSFQDGGAYQLVPQVASPLSSRPTPPPKIPLKSPCISIQTANLTRSISKPDEDSPDLISERALRQETEARILQKQTYLEQKKQLLAEQQQEIHQIEEDIYYEQILLGPAKRPAHLNAKNLFDDISAHAVGEALASSSPGDMTIVGLESDSNLESQSPATTSSTHRVPSTPEEGLDYDHYHSVDLLMEDLVPEQDTQGNTLTYTSNKKRKRLSFLPTAEPAVYHEKQTNANPSIDRFDTGRATEAVRRQTSSKHFAEGNDAPTTSRPTSWPRSCLLRRSAGVSVRKITEVFEKLRLQRDKPLPAPPAAAGL
ncbi:MAG: hypothetical protein Q9215_006708 [Flavoplaca cf. flavocitrina]